MTFHLGTWIVPAIITIIIMGFAHWEARRHNGPPGPGQAVEAAIGLIAYLVGGILSLAAWLVWALA